MRAGLSFLGVVALAGCRFGFDDRTPGDGAIDMPADAPSCNPVTPGDFASWPMPNFTAGLPNPAAYTVGPTGDTIHDTVTGLVWQRSTPPQKMSQAAAQAYCESLMLEGVCDWRLPERIELISIADYTKYDPTIATSVFDTTVSDAYWSVTPMRNMPTQGWYVSFLNGLIGTTTVSSTYNVRCVRGGGQVPPAHYTSTIDIALDNGTKLTWERVVDVGNYNHAQAMARCSTLTTAGGAWRSPSINELESLVDTTQVSPSIHTLTFPSTPASLFWSKNVQVSDMSQGWTVNFDNGTVARALTTALPVRCVR